MATYETIDACEIQHETAKALLVRFENGDELWVPKSVIAEDDLGTFEIGDVVELNIATWFAEKEGLS